MTVEAKAYDLEALLAGRLYGLTAKPDGPGFTCQPIPDDDDQDDAP